MCQIFELKYRLRICYFDEKECSDKAISGASTSHPWYIGTFAFQLLTCGQDIGS